MASSIKREAEGMEISVNKLKDEVTYEAGAIASKTIIDRKATSVVVFAFDKFQQIIEHTLPYEALFYVLEGEAEVVISGNPCTVKEGGMVTFPANKPHAISAKSKFKMMLITIKE